MLSSSFSGTMIVARCGSSPGPRKTKEIMAPVGSAAMASGVTPAASPAEARRVMVSEGRS